MKNKIEIGTIINNLKVINMFYVQSNGRMKSNYLMLTLKCLKCGDEFEKSCNAFKLGYTLCQCSGGYRNRKIKI